jgi:hypothetical protein
MASWLVRFLHLGEARGRNYLTWCVTWRTSRSVWYHLWKSRPTRPWKLVLQDIPTFTHRRDCANGAPQVFKLPHHLVTRPYYQTVGPWKKWIGLWILLPSRRLLHNNCSLRLWSSVCCWLFVWRSATLWHWKNFYHRRTQVPRCGYHRPLVHARRQASTSGWCSFILLRLWCNTCLPAHQDFWA